jgi:IclR family transcriptional regulator, pca regulon regulatory protein
MSRKIEPNYTDEVPGDEFARFAGNPDFVLSLARGLKVIEAFSGKKGGVSPSEIATETGFSRAAVRRLLVTLEALGYARGDGRTYVLSTPVLKLGFSYLSSASLPALAQPLIERLSEEIHESVSVSEMEEDHIVYVARASTKRVMSVALSIGSRLPAYCTSMGRVLLAALPEEEIVRYLERVELRKMTPRTIVEKSILRDILRQVASNGFALTDEELELGLRSVAVPVRSRQGLVVAAMNIGVPAARVSQSEMMERLLPKLQREAAMLGNMLS